MKRFFVTIFIISLFSCGRNELLYDITPQPDGGDLPPTVCREDSDCDDGNICNGIERCIEGVCTAGEPIVCDDGIDCTADSCNERTGDCVFIPDHDKCDYNEICDPELGCITRRCSSSEDCNDSIYCNGQEYCENETCRPGLPPFCDDGIECTRDWCDEILDSCAHETDDTLCDDGLYCNGIERCDISLGCLFGETINCDDHNPCTFDFCDELRDSCTHTPRDQDSDGYGDSACGGDDCNDTDPTVYPGAQEICHDLKDNNCNNRTDCEDGSCYTDPRCQPIQCNNDRDCDDHDLCNGQERCVNGICQPGTPVNCDDRISCTIDSCNPSTGQCRSTPNDNLCPPGYYCDPQRDCQPRGCTSDRDCDDGNSCTIDRCNQTTGQCTHTPRDQDNDGYGDSACGGDDCNDTDPTVYPGAQEICHDLKDNNCNNRTDCEDSACYTDPRCQPIQCNNDRDCDDHDLCNGQERCVNGICQPGTPLNCDDRISCTIDSCNPSTGQCTHTPDDSRCSNALICDGQERCNPQTGCEPGTHLNCDDRDPCTEDQCVEPRGCIHSILDRDDDNYGDINCGGADCNDTNPNINPAAREICNDNIDNNCNNLIDCNDNQCRSDPSCCVPSPEICNDNIDNDCDGATDCSDPNCFRDPICGGCRPEVCWDGVDNDCDNRIDCQDTDCSNDPACQICQPEICDDGLDNDCDNFTDCSDTDCFNNIVCQNRNDTCAQAIEIGPGTYYGTTYGYINDYQPNPNVDPEGDCWGGVGPDAVYTFVITQNSRVIINTFGSNFDTVVYVRSIRCPNGEQVQCNDDYQSLQSYIDIPNLQRGRYFIFVDGYGTQSFGDYTLTLEIRSPGPTQEICNNFIDDDNDQLVDCDDPDCRFDPNCICIPTEEEIYLWTCTDGTDNDCDQLTDCDDDGCMSNVSIFSGECCNYWDDNGNGLVDEFACGCNSDWDCTGVGGGNYVCHDAGGKCGLRCNRFGFDWCPWVYPGSHCDRQTGHCVY